MKLLVNIFKKYEALAAQDEVKRQKMLQDRESQTASTEKNPSATITTQTSPPVEVVKPIEPASDPVQPVSIDPADNRGSVGETHATAEQTPTSPSQQAPQLDCGGDEPMETKESEAGKEEDEQERLQKIYQANPESYNGAVRENYSWSQSITDTDVRVKVPKSVAKGKDVQVEIGKKRLCVRYRDPDGEWREGVNGELSWEVRADESMWTLTPGQYVLVNLEKKEERWWEAVFVNEPKINTRKIDCSRPITDLDDEAQAKIEEMMYNEHRKRLGLPQSHEQKTMDMLRQAWDAEGSPFQGRPFDPSAISVDPSGVVKMN